MDCVVHLRMYNNVTTTSHPSSASTISKKLRKKKTKQHNSGWRVFCFFVPSSLRTVATYRASVSLSFVFIKGTAN